MLGNIFEKRTQLTPRAAKVYGMRMAIIVVSVPLMIGSAVTLYQRLALGKRTSDTYVWGLGEGRSAYKTKQQEQTRPEYSVNNNNASESPSREETT